MTDIPRLSDKLAGSETAYESMEIYWYITNCPETTGNLIELFSEQAKSEKLTKDQADALTKIKDGLEQLNKVR